MNYVHFQRKSSHYPGETTLLFQDNDTNGLYSRGHKYKLVVEKGKKLKNKMSWPLMASIKNRLVNVYFYTTQDVYMLRKPRKAMVRTLILFVEIPRKQFIN